MGFYKNIASGYDELYSSEQERKIGLIKKKIRLSGILLDVGCGTGISTGFWKETKLKVGVDSCIELLKIAKAKHPNCIFICAMAESLPFKSGIFDSGVCLTALHNFDDAKKALKELKRVCKKKSQLVISVLRKSRHFDELTKLIKNHFQIEEELKDLHDMILIKKN